MDKKNLTTNLIFISFCAIVTYYLIWGTNGVKTYFTFKNKIETKKAQVKALETEVLTLNNQIKQWQSDEFELEKTARQELNMSCTNELVYQMPQKLKK